MLLNLLMVVMHLDQHLKVVLVEVLQEELRVQVIHRVVLVDL